MQNCTVCDALHCGMPNAVVFTKRWLENEEPSSNQSYHIIIREYSCAVNSHTRCVQFASYLFNLKET